MDLSGAIYGRISQLYGETDDSLDNQVGQAEGAAAALSVPIRHVFREKDSGHETAETRIELLKVRTLIRGKRITHLFIHNFDRLSRTPEELVCLWKEALQHGVKIVVCLWPQFHDLDLEMAKMMLRMIGMVGEFEWSFIRTRTTQNKQKLRDKGLVVGEGGPRFGFTWDRETRSRKPSEAKHPVFKVSSAEIVRTIFELIGVHRYSLRRTARELNQRGWPTPAVFRGKQYRDGRRPQWTNDGVRLIVVDEQYKGVVTCSRTRMVGKRKSKKKPREEWTVLQDARTEPLVTPELWRAANQQIRENDVIGKRTRAKRSAAETRNENNFALFRGLITCAECGRPLRPVWAKTWNHETKDHTGPKDRIYRCDSRVDAFERGASTLCKGRAVYERKVKAAVWAQVVTVASDEGLIRAQAERLKHDRPGESLHRASHKSALDEAEAADRRVRNLVASLAETDDAEDRSMIRAAIEDAKKARESHRRQAARLEEQLAAYNELDRRADELIARCKDLQASSRNLLDMPDEEKRYWLEGLGVTIVGNATKLQVRFDMGLVEGAAAETEEKSKASTFQHRRGSSRMTSPILERSVRVWLEYPVAG